MPLDLAKRLFRAPRTKVVGVGWAKTGTTSLGLCLKSLGYDHTSMHRGLVRDWAQGDMSRLLPLMRKLESFEDWPWPLLYREFDREFPGTRFILTTRDSGRWIKSYLNQIHQPGHFTPEMNEIRQMIYGCPFPGYTPEQLIARYERHNAEVRDYFRGRDNFIELSWERGHGWEELCDFLGHPVPSASFPHANRGVYRACGAAAIGLSCFSNLAEVAELAAPIFS